MKPPRLPQHSLSGWYFSSGGLLRGTTLVFNKQRASGILALCMLLFTKAYGQENSFPYRQSFEESFATGTATAFLPQWWANEVAASSRIFQTPLSHSGSAALGAEPTSTFVADVRLQLDTRSLQGARLSFWARGARNGSGSRPAQLLLSYSADGGASFSSPQLVATFANADGEYEEFSQQLPQELMQLPEAVIRWQVRRSEEGAGTTARVLLDDVLVEAATPQLALLAAEARSAQEVVLTFSMPPDPASAGQAQNYRLSPAVPISAAKRSDTNPHQVVLSTGRLTAGTYSLTVTNLLPAQGGDPLTSATISFAYTAAPQYRDIVINEIFADPNPKGDLQPQPVVLPTESSAEFVELFNASDEAHNLQELRLSGGQLPTYVLEPGAYVLAVPTGKAGLFSDWGPVVEVQAWRSLSNSGAHLELTHADSGRLLDSLTYALSWYQEPGKQEGGWSLEQINPYLQCSVADNWQAAADPKGATPAAPNSGLDTTEDRQPPQLLQALAIADQQLVLVFDEFLSPASLEGVQLRLDPARAIEDIWQQDNQLLVTLANPLLDNTSYMLYLSGLQDCSGNALSAEAPLIRPKPAEAGEVVINEIMFEPETDDPEWIELHNPGPHTLTLQGWHLGLREGQLRNTAGLSNQFLLIPPQGYLLLAKDVAALQQAHAQLPPHLFLEVEDMPALRNTGDTLVLLTPVAAVADIAVFGPDWHHPLLATTKGVSLERLDPLRSGLLPANWTSAAAPAYATPGRANSQRFVSTPTGPEVLRIEPEVLEPTPDGVADVTFIHYQLSQAGLSGTLHIIDASGREVVRLADNVLLSQEGVFQWSGTTPAGERVRNGYYIVVLSVWGSNGFSQKWRKTLVVSSWL